MAAISFNDDIEFRLRQCPLICITRFRIEYRQNSLVWPGRRHIDIWFEVSHQETVLPVVGNARQHCVLVVRVDISDLIAPGILLSEFNKSIGIQLPLIAPHSYLLQYLLRILLRCRIVYCWLIRISIHSISIFLIFTWYYALQQCIDCITNTTTHYVHRHLVFMQLSQQVSCVGSECHWWIG